MVEEQAGIQVVGQVDQQLHPAFLDLHEAAFGVLPFVLLLADLPLAALDHDALRRNVQRLWQRGQRIEQAGLGLGRVDGFRRGIFLNVRPVAVDIHGQCVLRHVGVIQAIALDLFPTRPLAQLLEVLLQAIGEHLAALAEACRLAARCGAVGLLALAAFAGHELLRHYLQQQQLAGQGAVPEGVLLVAADAHALAQLRGAGEDAGAPAQTALAQTLAKVLVEIEQARLVAEAFAIGRVADHQAALALVRARLESRQLALIHLHPLAQARALDIVARRLDQPGIGLVTANPQRRLRQPGSRTLLRVLQQLLP
ncbi:hypothetical protein D3C81_1402340 [compost metagenome]